MEKKEYSTAKILTFIIITLGFISNLDGAINFLERIGIINDVSLNFKTTQQIGGILLPIFLAYFIWYFFNRMNKLDRDLKDEMYYLRLKSRYRGGLDWNVNHILETDGHARSLYTDKEKIFLKDYELKFKK